MSEKRKKAKCQQVVKNLFLQRNLDFLAWVQSTYNHGHGRPITGPIPSAWEREKKMTSDDALACRLKDRRPLARPHWPSDPCCHGGPFRGVALVGCY